MRKKEKRNEEMLGFRNGTREVAISPLCPGSSPSEEKLPVLLPYPAPAVLAEPYVCALLYGAEPWRSCVLKWKPESSSSVDLWVDDEGEMVG
jgi:hypothetical protein